MKVWNRPAAHRHGVSRWLTGVALAALPSVTLAAQPPPPAATAVQESPTIDAVVVTARRKAEVAIDVPIALTVLDGDKLARAGLDNLKDIYLQVPSLRVIDVNPRNPVVTIRGLGASLANESLVNSVGVFVDGVYQARPAAAAFAQFGLEQIEVLRGPQGTLFGKNTTAGALNITTRKPSFTPEAALEASVGSYNFYEVAGTVSGPITRTLAGRLTVSTKERDGFISDKTGDNKYYDQNEQNLRAQLLWRPIDDFSLRLIADYETQRTHCCVDVFDKITTSYDDGATIPNNFAFRTARLGYTPLPVDPFARKVDIDSPQLVRTAQGGVSAETNWIVGGGTLTTITAFRTWRFDPQNDLDVTALPILTQGAFRSRAHQVSEEIRWSSKIGDRFDYTAGFFYFYESLASETTQRFGSAAGGFILPGLPLTLSGPALDGLVGAGHDRAYAESFAGFGQGAYKMTSKLSVTGGLRYTYEKKFGYANQFPLAGAPLSSFAPALQPTITAIRAGSVIAFDTRTTPGAPQDEDEGNFSGTASVSYRFSPDINTYASYARGYKAGGINFAVVPAGASQIIRPEVADDYELGVKARLFGRRLSVNAALFWTEIEDFQATQLFLNPATGGFASYVTNAAQLRSRGAEIDAQARVSPEITFDGSVAYTDASYRSYPNAPCALVNAGARCDLAGVALPNVSKWALHGGVSYQPDWSPGQIGGEAVKPFLNADVAYRSGFLGSASRFTRIDGYTVANLTVGARLPGHGVTLSFWVHNLFDEEYFITKTALIFNTGGISGQLGDPRTVGATIKKTF